MSAADDFYGRPDLLRDLDQFRCKVNWLAARRRYVESHFGEEGLREVVARLQRDELTRAFLEPPLPMSWTDVATVVAIDRAIYEGPMKGSLLRMREFGGEIASYDVNGVYRALFRVASPRFVFSKIGRIWSLYYDRGTLTCEAGDRGADIALHDAVLPRYLCAYGVVGWLDTMLELVGARAPSVQHPHCVHRGNDQCAWRVRWLE